MSTGSIFYYTNDWMLLKLMKALGILKCIDVFQLTLLIRHYQTLTSTLLDNQEKQSIRQYINSIDERVKEANSKETRYFRDDDSIIIYR